MTAILVFCIALSWLSTPAANPVTPASSSGSTATPKDSSKRDEALNEYFSDILEGLKAFTRTGLKAIKLPVLDPLILGSRTFSYRTEKTRLDATFNNVSIKGLADFEVIDLNVDVPRLQVLLKVEVPDIIIDGHYELNGVAMHVLPVRGRGPWHVHLVNLTATALVKLNLNDKREIRLRMLSLVGDVADSQIRFENLIDKGDLGRVVNKILQTNSRRILVEGLKELRGTMEEAASRFTDVLDAEFILEMRAAHSTIKET